ncbi:MAG: IclR family transcriptional regulator [Proteobacteria bacterium]|nr:IclR family transcriptional regulator [Pseudomonadota bacterium]
MNSILRPDETEARKGTQSLQRAIALLREVTACGSEGLSAAEMAARASIDRTTAHRMARSLAAEGLFDYSRETRRYFLGPLAYEIGLAASERADLAKLCATPMKRIAEETGDTVFLMLRSGDDAVCVARTEGSYPVKTFVVDVGVRRPLGVGAGSLAIFSALPLEEREVLLKRNAARLAQYPGMTVAKIRARAAASRGRDQAVGDVVDVPNVRAAGVVIRTPGGRPVASLSISAIAPRFANRREAKLLAILHREAEALRKTIGRTIA